jgi:hypothetical protein
VCVGGGGHLSICTFNCCYYGEHTYLSCFHPRYPSLAPPHSLTHSFHLTHSLTPAHTQVYVYTWPKLADHYFTFHDLFHLFVICGAFAMHCANWHVLRRSDADGSLLPDALVTA